MNYYNEQLKNLAVQIDRKHKLTIGLQELYERRRILKEQICELENTRKKETQDTELTKGSSLAVFFYHVICKTDGKPEKEKAEAYAAAVKYDVVSYELGMVECDIRCMEEELYELHGCKERYDRAMEEKREVIQQKEIFFADRILRIQENIVRLKVRKRELEELILAGQDILYTLEEFLETLDDAKKWGMKEFFVESSLFDDEKCEILDAGQDRLEELQVQFGRFYAELADINVKTEGRIKKEESLLDFANVFLDNLLTDLIVFDTICQSEKYTEEVKTQLENILAQLEFMRGTMIRQQREEKQRMEALILQVV